MRNRVRIFGGVIVAGRKRMGIIMIKFMAIMTILSFGFLIKKMEAKMIKSCHRGHSIIFVDNAWVYEDNGKPVPGYGGEDRPCKFCGHSFGRGPDDEDDPCLGHLPGVVKACCGHGVRKDSYIVFENGFTIAGFEIVKEIPKRSRIDE